MGTMSKMLYHTNCVLSSQNFFLVVQPCMNLFHLLTAVRRLLDQPLVKRTIGLRTEFKIGMQLTSLFILQQF
ncbi:Uncharacterized protein TCM_022393 [Theobroma cacao]|uniref:Uncharacterized protein n=1 Tax=Theobroma cacao TaxID=3641 RepID=A0A061EUJ7_THECC|nr:Uncharacterized protein TCM_022393 [Theobroma cacao]